MELGYACVSTTKQSLDRQLATLTGAGMAAQQIYSEGRTEVAADRPELTALLGNVRAGDTITVDTLDILSNDLRKVVNLVQDLAVRGIRVRSLAYSSRPDEQFALKVVGQVLGASVHLWDINGQQHAVEAVMAHYSGGRIAALEVSSIGPQDEARIINYLDRRGYRRNISGLTRVWYAQVPKDFHPNDLHWIDTALLRCEALGIDRARRAVGQDSDIDALLRRGVRAGAISAETPEARAYVLVRGVGGPGGRGIEPLVDELAEELQTPTMWSKIDKLAATGIEERHLLLVVRPSAFSFPVYDGLSFGGPLPSRPPRLPDGLSQVWLLSRVAAGGVVRAVAGGGWHRDYPFGQPI
jgi:hypothetical protein